MTKDKLLQIIEKHGAARWEGKCHDCEEFVDVDAGVSADGNGVEVSGGAVYEIKRDASMEIYLKCNECFKEDKTLRKYQDNEVYSRVVGYLRPVSQWNPGKVEEFKNRKLFGSALNR